ncbi:MAG: hypothetical protein ACRBBN_05050 [Methyloligellaceae bacterium]
MYPGKLIYAIIQLSIAITLISTVSASQPEQSQTLVPVKLYIFKDNLKNVILEIIHSSDISLKIDDNIRAPVKQLELKGTRSEVLNKLSRKYAFDWFEYNNTLYISRKDMRITRFLKAAPAQLKSIIKQLEENGSNINSFNIRQIDKDSLSASAPASYIAIVETLLEQQSPSKKRIYSSNKVKLYKGVKLHNIQIDIKGR